MARTPRHKNPADVEIQFVDLDSSPDLDNAARFLAKRNGLGIQSTRDLYAVATRFPNMLGALFTNGASAPAAGYYTFDIVIEPHLDPARRHGIFRRLVRAAVAEHDELERAFDGEPIPYEVHVVHPYARKVLESFGFKVTQELPGFGWNHGPAWYMNRPAAGTVRENPPGNLRQQLLALRPQLAAAAQEVYDAWDQSDEEEGDPELGFGGICQDVADAMANVLAGEGIDLDIVDTEGVVDQHVWVIAYLQTDDAVEAYHVDISPSTYETGSGYNWRKREGIKLRAGDVSIEPAEDYVVQENPGPGKYRFETTCVHSTGEKIDAMTSRARKVTYETMLKHCPDLVDFAVGLGYERAKNQGSGLTLKNDWSVSYHKSIYDGRPCYYFVWSHIEHIWTLQ